MIGTVLVVSLGEVMGKVTVLSVPVCKFNYFLLFTNCVSTGKCLQIQRGESGVVHGEYSYYFSCRSVKSSSLPSAMGPPSSSGSEKSC